jgi:hypothetical protein
MRRITVLRRRRRCRCMAVLRGRVVGVLRRLGLGENSRTQQGRRLGIACWRRTETPSAAVQRTRRLVIACRRRTETPSTAVQRTRRVGAGACFGEYLFSNYRLACLNLFAMTCKGLLDDAVCGACDLGAGAFWEKNCQCICSTNS